jgi:hypothetical protein
MRILDFDGGFSSGASVEDELHGWPPLYLTRRVAGGRHRDVPEQSSVWSLFETCSSSSHLYRCRRCGGVRAADGHCRGV